MDLSLGGTLITDAALEHVAAIPRLAVLFLRSTNITDRGLPRLYSMKRLVKINLSRTKVTADGIAALQAALPNCEIQWDGPSP